MSAFDPKRTLRAAAKSSLFDYLVGRLQEGFRDGRAKGFSGLEIDRCFVVRDAPARANVRTTTATNSSKL
jgi:hypothetical protein